MNEPTMIQLTKSLIENIKPKEIIYAEMASGGGMGNTGGIMLYLIKDDTLICYETNIFEDEEIYNQAAELLLKHQDTFENADVELQDILFDHFYGGMGNNVFVKKNINLEINEGYFIYKKDSKEHKILPSVQGVFNSVVYAMNNPKSDER
jgi:hypothetical protein